MSNVKFEGHKMIIQLFTLNVIGYHGGIKVL